LENGRRFETAPQKGGDATKNTANIAERLIG
jgi:hypothetical protein